MTVPTIEGTTEIYKLEGLILAEELEDGLVVLARSTMVDTVSPEYQEAFLRVLETGVTSKIKRVYMDHSKYDNVWFRGPASIVEVWV